LARRVAALLIALAVTATGQSPCTAAALARAIAAVPAAGDAARQVHHGDHAASAHEADSGAQGHCDGASTTMSARCRCGCTGDLSRAAASTFSAAWALPAPPLAQIGPGGAPAPLGRRVRPAKPAPSPIDHVPVIA
jgi:hypothetical protein